MLARAQEVRPQRVKTDDIHETQTDQNKLYWFSSESLRLSENKYSGEIGAQNREIWKRTVRQSHWDLWMMVQAEETRHQRQ